MSTAMQSKGIVFLGAKPPQASKAADGTYTLTMRVLDRYGNRQPAAWLLLWTGDAAKAWHDRHASDLVPGAVLEVVCSHICPYALGRIPEVHAHIEACTLIRKAAHHSAVETH